MQSEQKAKTAAMRAIMSNPKLSKILEEGFNSPISSTKRAKAKSIMSIIKKVGTKNSQAKLSDLLDHASNVSGSQNPYKKLYEGAFSGVGGSGGGMSTRFPTSPYGLSSPYVLNRAPSTPKAQSYSFNPAGVFQEVSAKTGSFAPNKKSSLFGGLSDLSMWGDPMSTQTANTTPAFHPKVVAGVDIKKSTPDMPQLNIKAPATTPAPATTTDESGYYDPSSIYTDSDFGQFFVGDNPLAGTIYENQWGTLPKDIQDSLKSSLTGGMFATVTMADREKLRALFPGLSPEQLPWGAGLQGQIDDLRGRLREEFQLDKIANEREELIRSGSTLFNDLTDYVRGRDTFIKSVDSMIDNVKNNMLTGSGSPADIKANNIYMDYLTVLKGRQNKRYVELLNTSMDNYNKKIEHITNEYNSKFDAYREALSLDSEITIGQYTQMFNDLSGMWTLVSNAPAMARQAAAEEAEINAINAKTLAEMLELEMLKLQGTNTNLDFDAYKKYKDLFVGKDGGFVPGADLYKDLQAVLASGDQLNVSTITRMFEDAIRSSGDNFNSIQEIKDKIIKFKNDGGDNLMLEATISIDPTTGNYTSPYANPVTGEGNFSAHLLDVLGTKVFNTMNKQIDTLAWPSIQTAVNWLSKYDKDEIGSKRKATKDKFDSANASVDENIRNAMWEYYVSALSDPVFNKDRNSRKAIFADNPERFVTQISGFLSKNY